MTLSLRSFKRECDFGGGRKKSFISEWLNAQNLLNEEKLSVASADASFRRYFRLQNKETSYIAMDAPPDLEDSLPFVEIGNG